MSDYDKAAHIISVLARCHRPAVFLTPENVLRKCSKSVLELYYRKLVLKE